MVDNYYKHIKKPKDKRVKKILGLTLITFGLLFFLYSFLPLISWKFYFADAFERQKIDSPVPFSTLVSNSTGNFGKNYYDASSWYPNFDVGEKKVEYLLSIPSIEVMSVKVSNADTDLTRHLVQYNSDSFPGSLGNVVIFGHSTLPQLFSNDDFKSIFSNLYKVKVGDTIDIEFENKKYTYKIIQSLVVEPDDTSVLAQDFSGSLLTLITCTPPGTVWKRLIIKAKLV